MSSVTPLYSITNVRFFIRTLHIKFVEKCPFYTFLSFWSCFGNATFILTFLNIYPSIHLRGSQGLFEHSTYVFQSHHIKAHFSQILYARNHVTIFSSTLFYPLIPHMYNKIISGIRNVRLLSPQYGFPLLINNNI